MHGLRSFYPHLSTYHPNTHSHSHSHSQPHNMHTCTCTLMSALSFTHTYNSMHSHCKTPKQQYWVGLYDDAGATGASPTPSVTMPLKRMLRGTDLFHAHHLANQLSTGHPCICASFHKSSEPAQRLFKTESSNVVLVFFCALFPHFRASTLQISSSTIHNSAKYFFFPHI